MLQWCNDIIICNNDFVIISNNSPYNNVLWWCINSVKIESCPAILLTCTYRLPKTKPPCSCLFRVFKCVPVWWMRIDIHSVLSSILAFSMDLKRISTHFVLGLPSRWNLCNPLVRLQSSSLSQSSSPCLSSGNHSRRLFQKIIQGLEGKINGQVLQHSLGWSDRQAFKHRAFPSLWQSLLAVTSLLEENVLPLLQYWLSSRV